MTTTQKAAECSRGWFRGLLARLGGGPSYNAETASLFSSEERVDDRSHDEMSVADIPTVLRRQLEEDAIRRTFHRLEMPLRLLMYATSPDREPESPTEFRDILNLWRQRLEQEVLLTPDAYAGAVRDYDPAMEREYTIHGRCRTGEPVRILIPCWRLNGEVVVRGEAEPIPSSREGRGQSPVACRQ
jgi:hypothetical protein